MKSAECWVGGCVQYDRYKKAPSNISGAFLYLWGETSAENQTPTHTAHSDCQSSSCRTRPCYRWSWRSGRSETCHRHREYCFYPSAAPDFEVYCSYERISSLSCISFRSTQMFIRNLRQIKTSSISSEQHAPWSRNRKNSGCDSLKERFRRQKSVDFCS